MVHTSSLDQIAFFYGETLPVGYKVPTQFVCMTRETFRAWQKNTLSHDEIVSQTLIIETLPKHALAIDFNWASEIDFREDFFGFLKKIQNNISDNFTFEYA